MDRLVDRLTQSLDKASTTDKSIELNLTYTEMVHVLNAIMTVNMYHKVCKETYLATSHKKVKECSAISKGNAKC